jgi:hypothetical protein
MLRSLPRRLRGGLTVAALATAAVGSAVTAAVSGAVIFGMTIGATAAAVIGGVAGMLSSRILSQVLGGGEQAPNASSAVQARDNGQTINIVSTDEPIPVAIGYCTNVACIVVFKDVIAPYFYMVCVASEGEIAGFDACYLDGVDSTDPKFAGLVTIEYHVGTDAQAASPMLLADFPTKFTMADLGAGVAYAVVKLKQNNTAFPRGEPTVTFDLRGVLLKDTRDGVTRFQNSPALAIRKFWTNTRWGRRIAEARIDDTRISAEATYFEGRENVPATALTFTVDAATDMVTWSAEAPYDNGDGITLTTTTTLPGGLALVTKYFYMRYTAKTGKFASTYANSLARTPVDITGVGTGVHTGTHVDQPRYTCNGLLDPSLNPYDNLPKLRSSCRSWFFEAGGLFNLVCDKPVAGPYKPMNKDVIVGEWTIDLGGEDGYYNRVDTRYINPFKYTRPDFVTSSNAGELADDGGKVLRGKLTLDFTTNPYMAQRLTQIERRASRLGIRVSHTVTVAGFQHFCGDVIQHTHETPGWTDKLFRIMNIQPHDDDELLIELREYSDAVWTLDAQSAMPIPKRTNLVNPINVIPITPPDISGLELAGQGNDYYFTGPNARAVWREASAVGGSMDWWRSYVVRIMKPDGTILRTEWPTTPFYTYRLEDNYDDNNGVPIRKWSFVLTNLSRYSPPRESAHQAILTVENAAPTAGAPAVTASVKGLVFTFPKPTDPDFNGYKLWGSTVNGFTANDSTLLYSGFDTEKIIGNLTTGVAFYFKYCAADTFGDGDISTQQTASPGVVALSVDLQTGAATEAGAASSQAGYVVPASLAGGLVLESVVIVPNPSAPATPIIQAVASISTTAGGEYTPYVESYDFTGTYAVGTVSISEVGGFARLTGSGTAWLGNIAVGDRIGVDRGNGILWWFRANSIPSDTRIDTLDFAAAGIAIGGVAYTAYKGVALNDGASASQADVVIPASGLSQVACLFSGAATSSNPAYVGRIYVFQSNMPGSTGTVSRRCIQVLQSRR